MSTNPKQVQLRGGTSEEHNSFTGAPREITIDTTKNTIRVHDGRTLGGHIICKSSELNAEVSRIDSVIEDMKNNLGGSHNHDDRYASSTHNHDSIYHKKLNGTANVISKVISGYPGICNESGGDDGWFRTTKSGIIPYQSGGYSAIGSSSWRFNDGWFNNLNSSYCYSNQLQLPGGGARNQIKYANDDYISYDDGTNEFSFISDNSVDNSFIKTGSCRSTKYAIVGSTRLYIQSSDPGNVPVGSVWIKV